MSAKLATPGFLKIKLFRKKGYDVIIPNYDVTNIIPGYDVTNKILSRESNYIVGKVMWPKVGKSSIFMREVIITSILWGFDHKKHFFWGVVLVQFFEIGTRYETIKTKS